MTSWSQLRGTIGRLLRSWHSQIRCQIRFRGARAAQLTSECTQDREDIKDSKARVDHMHYNMKAGNKQLAFEYAITKKERQAIFEPALARLLPHHARDVQSYDT